MSLKMNGYFWYIFSAVSDKGDSFYDFFPVHQFPSEKGVVYVSGFFFVFFLCVWGGGGGGGKGGGEGECKFFPLSVDPISKGSEN